MKKCLYGIVVVSVLFWFISLMVNPNLSWNVWTIRRELIYLTGIISFAFMSLIMLLAIRPKWLESVFGGLDKMYYLHKWAGIWAISLGAVHYLLKLAGKVLILYFERAPRMRMGGISDDFFIRNRKLAESLGEWTLWFLLAALVLTLWHKFAYHLWRYTHKLMAIAFLIIVFHTVILTPFSYWSQPVGILIGLGCLIGTGCALLSLFGLIGRRHTYQGQVLAIKTLDQYTMEITCKVNGYWQHDAGQYVFFTHDRFEGQHPFTIASADHNSNQIKLCIKALGDYTKNLQQNVKVGDAIQIEGPYGCFDFRKKATARQIWIAGGIGITPFLSWLESLQDDVNKDIYHADLYYCVRSEEEAIFVEKLQRLVASLPNINLHVQCSKERGYLTADKLNIEQNEQGNYPSIWFCGPTGFADSLKTNLSSKGYPLRLFHREYFTMR
ncbi:ferredoxin reductase family protein [Entomomonas asaccharolytica]|uniref:Ferric reductase-like transmembrane domain-containing protein n=1 Tax=Entomomonas asaccharolytica TaxID=2785331 RepID=A0A974NFU9_9GAMM|nr:ferric reductase-like transmembrane domain-containing protein [Entomomonas asaccharolytica]QQP85861.1 ferric reductase-like transmembrane domain-containing protein [Entomomonas asaccharolytica]